MKRIGAAVMLFFGCLLAAGAERCSITLLWTPQAQFAGVYYAREAGIFRRYGLEVDIRHKTPESAIFDYLRGGRSDFVIAPLTVALSERDRGLAVVNLLQLSQSSSLVLVARSSSGVTDAASLRNPHREGRPLRFGIWGVDFGMLPRILLRQQKVENPAIFPLGSDVLPFLWGAVDVVNVMEYNEYYQLLAGGCSSRSLVRIRLRECGLDIPEDGLYALESTVSARPEMCARFRAALLEGWREALNHREQALDYVRVYSDAAGGQFDPAHQWWMLDFFGRQLELSDPERAGRLSREKFDFTVRLLIGYGELQKPVDYALFCPDLPKLPKLPEPAEEAVP